MSNLTPSTGAAAVRTDGDNRYKAVQHKLKTLSTAMEQSNNELQALVRAMSVSARHADGLAVDIANAQLDTVFIDMTHQVAVALDGACVEVQKLHAAAEDVSARAQHARRRHARMYEGLDRIRSRRRERTPKPGFFLR
ncbi:conjugal transfer protein TraB [Streptomyces sp. G44]|uniref:conjugal transfer protein TraB n=1 Tax=Streptomyces sp. G44 TaxID=2807632 RepID=UPI00195FD0F2|nr:conjugal transfer protein TraB [Streptomyces sp. G44]MBM7167460.1 conjugal transfer protein TraB [Streptomyces sp. G44]